MIARLRKKIKDTEVVVKMSDETVSELKKRLKDAQEKPTQLRETITEALKEMLSEETKSDQNTDALLTDKDTVELVDFIVLSLRNHSIKKLENFQFFSISHGPRHEPISSGPQSLR